MNIKVWINKHSSAAKSATTQRNKLVFRLPDHANDGEDSLRKALGTAATFCVVLDTFRPNIF